VPNSNLISVAKGRFLLRVRRCLPIEEMVLLLRVRRCLPIEETVAVAGRSGAGVC